MGGQLHGTLQRLMVPRAQVSFEPNHVHAFPHHASIQPLITSDNTSTLRSTLAYDKRPKCVVS